MCKEKSWVQHRKKDKQIYRGNQDSSIKKEYILYSKHSMAQHGIGYLLGPAPKKDMQQKERKTQGPVLKETEKNPGSSMKKRKFRGKSRVQHQEKEIPRKILGLASRKGN
jgi:hypothetical protein